MRSLRRRPPCARELEIADLLSFIKHAGVRNTVWITADVHYTAAHHYDPNRAQFQDFAPFWSSSPVRSMPAPGGRAISTTRSSAGDVSQGLDARAGREPAPSFGLQFFGHVAIDGTSEIMTVTLKDMGNTALWSVDIAPQPQYRIGPA